MSLATFCSKNILLATNVAIFSYCTADVALFLAQNGKRAVALNGNKWQRTLRVLNGRAGFCYSMPFLAIDCH